MGLVIFITVPIGAVRCNTNFLFGSRSASSIQVATPCSSFSYKPYLLALKRFALALSEGKTTLVASGFAVTGAVGAGAVDWPARTLINWPGLSVVDVKPLRLVRSSTVVPKRFAIEYNVSPADTL